jgi:cold-inducible RNA-binding protein
MATRLFIGNINHHATENDLQDHFGSVGKVVAVDIILDRATGKPRGFGFVEMSSPDEAKKAIESFHNKEFQGRPLTVNEARPREPRPQNGGGGYRPRQ